MGRMLALPWGAALTAPTDDCGFRISDFGLEEAAGACVLSALESAIRNPQSAIGLPGRNGARCLATAIGPIPGPPPPWGMQNVLWRLRWQTSAPMSPGRQRPTWAFMLAPSM